MPTAPPGMSIDRGGARAAAHGPRAARRSPRWRACSARWAAPRPPTDPAPLGMVETVVVLKPRERVARRADLGRPDQGDGREAAATPACRTSGGCRSRRAPRCSPTGIRSPLGIKVFGDDLDDDRAAPRSRSSARWPQVPGHAQRVRRALDRRLLPRRRGRRARRPRATACASPTSTRWSMARDRRHERVARPSRAASATRSTCATRASSATIPRLLGRVLVADAGRRAGAARAGGRRSTFATGPPMIRSEDGKLVGFVFVDTRPPDRRLRRGRAARGGERGDAAGRACGSSGPGSSPTSSAPRRGCRWSCR